MPYIKSHHQQQSHKLRQLIPAATTTTEKEEEELGIPLVVVSKQVERRKAIHTEEKTLSDLRNSGEDCPGSDYHPSDRKKWMSELP
ncbi:hypothetical protein JHK85_031259 [Glycine max]|nr:hypothetical protein JHK85_031259 [Glycine max]